MHIPHVFGQHAFISLPECAISNLFFYAENSVLFPEVFWRKTACYKYYKFRTNQKALLVHLKIPNVTYPLIHPKA